MTTIVNLRGTSGSGKSTVVFDLMAQYPTEPIKEKGKIIGYVIHAIDAGDIYVLGRYETDCGGCDTIMDINVTRKLIKRFAKKGNVLFEGLIVNNAYAGNLEVMRKTKQDFHFAFLDTPLRTCISRVKKRRKAKGNTKPFNQENTVKMYHSNHRMLERAVQDRANPVVIDHKNATQEVYRLFGICL